MRKKLWMSKSGIESSVKTFNTKHKGFPAINADKGNGYKFGRMYGINVLAHRVAWCLYHGYWPSMLIDHINGNRSDNRKENLRDVSAQDNNRNRVRPPKNEYFGITYFKERKKWVARISVDGVNKCLGYFDNAHDAGNARAKAEKDFWGDIA